MKRKLKDSEFKSWFRMIFDGFQVARKSNHSGPIPDLIHKSGRIAVEYGDVNYKSNNKTSRTNLSKGKLDAEAFILRASNLFDSNSGLTEIWFVNFPEHPVAYSDFPSYSILRFKKSDWKLMRRASKRYYRDYCYTCGQKNIKKESKK